MEEMNALHEFMSKFSREIEVIWGAALEDDLTDEVKITLLATGFSITSVPGIEEHRLVESQAEELERKIREDAQKEQEEEDRQLIEKYYGKKGLKDLLTTNYRIEPIVLTTEELDDDKILEAMERTAVFKRDVDFNPRAFRNEPQTPSSSLFD